jgi:putative DNA methylase
VIYRKKLIEVALPLEAINAASALEKGNPFLKGHPRNLHQWWARRPLAAARAVIFAQMVDDPSAHPDRFPTDTDQDRERLRLFRIIEDLVSWDNTSNDRVLQEAHDEIVDSWRRTCSTDSIAATSPELFDAAKLPTFLDPFAGGGSIPLEAQRLGLDSYASDLNPVAVLICKAMMDVPPRYAGHRPINPESQAKTALLERSWSGAQGLAEDVRYYANWMQGQADNRMRHLYPHVSVTDTMATERPDLQSQVGKTFDVVAYLWARVVRSPNPAVGRLEVPLATTFMLSNKAGKEAYIEPVMDGSSYEFVVRHGTPPDMAATKRGTKASGSGSSFVCIKSGTPMPFEYLRAEGKAGRIGTRLMAVVLKGARGPIYLSPTRELEAIARAAKPDDVPETELPPKALGFRVQEYGMTKWRDLFTPRQLVALVTLSDLIGEVRDTATRDAIHGGMVDDGVSLESGGSGAQAYGHAIAVMLALCVDKLADYNNTICTWNPTNQNIGHLFTKQAIPMAWDFPEASPLDGGLSISSIAHGVAATIDLFPAKGKGSALQLDCAVLAPTLGRPVISTDPPYYDNIGYADLSDFFYVWLRRGLKSIFPNLFATLSAPKTQELIAAPTRHGTKSGAERFFLEGMTSAMHRLAEQSHPAFPVTIYYAFKQSETTANETASTGWETFLEAVIRAGFALTGTWPIRTERQARSVGLGTNALASSIVLVCRPRPLDARITTRRDFAALLRAELPSAMRSLQKANIAPVDFAQSAIGPGMALFTRFEKVLGSDGERMPVRTALALINEVLDELLADQEGALDAPTRWAVAWFEQFGFGEGPFGVAETLSKAKNTSIASLVDDGLVDAPGGSVRLKRPEELDPTWDARKANRIVAWEVTHQLSRALSSGGERAAAVLLKPIGGLGDVARDLAYRLFVTSERKKWTRDALAYNSLVIAWPDLVREAKSESDSSRLLLFEEA